MTKLSWKTSKKNDLLKIVSIKNPYREITVILYRNSCSNWLLLFSTIIIFKLVYLTKNELISILNSIFERIFKKIFIKLNLLDQIIFFKKIQKLLYFTSLTTRVVYMAYGFIIGCIRQTIVS